MATTNSDHPHSQPLGNITWREEISNILSDDEDDTWAKQPIHGGVIEEADRWAAGSYDGQVGTRALTRRQKKQRKRLEADITHCRPDRQGRAIRRSAAAALPASEGRRLAQWSNAGQKTKAFQSLADLLDGFDFADPTTQMKNGPTLPDDAEEQTSLAAVHSLRKAKRPKMPRTTEPTQSQKEHRAHSRVLFLVQKKYAKELGVTVKQYRQMRHPEDDETTEQLQARLVATARPTMVDLHTGPQLKNVVGDLQATRYAKILLEVQKKIAQALDVALADYKLNGPHAEDEETFEKLRARLKGMRRQNREPKHKTKARNRKTLALERGISENQIRPDGQVKSELDRKTIRAKERRARKRKAAAEKLTAGEKAIGVETRELSSQKAVRNAEPFREGGEGNNLEVSMATTLSKERGQDPLWIKLEHEMEF